MIAAAPPDVHALLAPLAPDGVDLRVAEPGALGDVEVLVVDGMVPFEGIDGMDALRVVLTLSAGTDAIEPHLPRGVTLCNARGARDVPVAEWVVGALLAAQTRLLEAALDRSWEHRTPAELAGSTVVVLGYGSIGAAVRERLEAFGAEVVPVGRDELSDLPELLPRADAVVVLAPHTSDTEGMVDGAFLARMRDGALLVNAGRGAVVDTDALVAELEAGRLRAVLDVTEPEPLPDGHPLWGLALAVSSHLAGDSDAADRRAAQLAADQLGRLVRGEELVNVVVDGGR